MLQSAADAGIKIIEFAARADNAKEVFTQMVAFKKANNLDVKIAVGSILSVDDAQTFHQLGADCIVCPHTDPEIGNYCLKNNIYWIPGAATLNEILHANKLGADVVKLFPADKIGGSRLCKSDSSAVSEFKNNANRRRNFRRKQFEIMVQIRRCLRWNWF